MNIFKGLSMNHPRRGASLKISLKHLDDDVHVLELLVGWELELGGVDVVPVDWQNAGGLTFTKDEIGFSFRPISPLLIAFIVQHPRWHRQDADHDHVDPLCVPLVPLLVVWMQTMAHPILNRNRIEKYHKVGLFFEIEILHLPFLAWRTLPAPQGCAS